MNAAEMIEQKIAQYEDAAGNHAQPRLMRDFRLFLESVSFELEKEHHRLNRSSSFRPIDSSDRIIEVNVVNNDHNLADDHKYDDMEQY